MRVLAPSPSLSPHVFSPREGPSFPLCCLPRSSHGACSPRSCHMAPSGIPPSNLAGSLAGREVKKKGKEGARAHERCRPNTRNGRALRLPSSSLAVRSHFAPLCALCEGSCEWDAWHWRERITLSLPRRIPVSLGRWGGPPNLLARQPKTTAPIAHPPTRHEVVHSFPHSSVRARNQQRAAPASRMQGVA